MSDKAHFQKLRAVKAADVLGLTEAQVLKKLELDQLNPGGEAIKWFSSGVIHFPTLGGHLIERHHYLTFAAGCVVEYDFADVMTACITTAPARP